MYPAMIEGTLTRHLNFFGSLPGVCGKPEKLKWSMLQRLACSETKTIEAVCIIDSINDIGRPGPRQSEHSEARLASAKSRQR